MKNAKKVTGSQPKTVAKTHKNTSEPAHAASAKSSSKSTPAARQHSTVSENAVSRVTTDHVEIQRWAEERQGQPACVRGTGGKGDIGMIRIDFPGYSGETSLEPISWDEWFEQFDERGLALLYQEETAAGQRSNFNKIVSRETAEAATKPKTKRAGGR